MLLVKHDFSDGLQFTRVSVPERTYAFILVFRSVRSYCRTCVRPKYRVHRLTYIDRAVKSHSYFYSVEKSFRDNRLQPGFWSGTFVFTLCNSSVVKLWNENDVKTRVYFTRDRVCRMGSRNVCRIILGNWNGLYNVNDINVTFSNEITRRLYKISLRCILRRALVFVRYLSISVKVGRPTTRTTKRSVFKQ